MTGFLGSFREELGKAFVLLGEEMPDWILVTSDVGKSTKTAAFAERFPERFINVGIAEQNAVGLSAGLASVDFKVVYTAYAMFGAGRSWEIIRNFVCYPTLDVKIVCSHGGINVGKDGVTHQATEDLALMRSLPHMKVLVVADPGETEDALRLALRESGPVYVRLGRANAVKLEHTEPWEIGRWETLREGCDATIIAIGLLVERALVAAEELSRDGIECRVINARSLKPIDRALLEDVARGSGLVVTAEDHNVYGGLYSAVGEAFSGLAATPRVVPIAIQDEFAESGDGLELMDKYGLTAAAIAAAVRKGLYKRE